MTVTNYSWSAPLRRERHFGNRVVDCYPERPANVFAMLSEAVAHHPDRTALVCAGRRLSYRALSDEVARVASSLAARGLGQGDRIALLLGNGIPFVVLVYAAAQVGAVTVPLSVRDQRPGIRHALVNSGAKAVVTEEEFTSLIPDAGDAPGLAVRISVGGAPGFEEYEALFAAPPLTRTAETGEEDAASILYTSGTTGVPKGAILTGLGIVHSATNFVTMMDLGPDDCSIMVVPMNHVTGLVAGIHTVVRAAGTLVVMREFSVQPFLETAAREAMTFSVMVPAMYNLCLHRATLSDYDLAAWRIGGYGGAPMPAATIERMADALPGLGLMNVYGATELTSPATAMPVAETARRRLSVGLPVPGAEICVMDETGREVPAGTSGELWIRGAMTVPGYWNNPEATEHEFVAGFWKSGDVGSVDEDGFVYVHDRKKDLVNRGGHKVFSSEVESVLTAYPGVFEAAVVAKPCPILGERVHAVLSIAEDGIDEDRLRQHCAGNLADYKCPESFSLQETPLPRNANGKIMKRQIREALGFT
ncbi:class I adenylate-forming enzyme family protein [Thalassovita aquimarina]|uniref:Acyl--CoA ligase n=1 Tax=Thalassovita aquimarina TaxID=2785917 RepID=A0ABS5HVY1_9RHOB|nr:class I adenylate-forming enzyme family protein [Thalassovita aquimarina]MBR9652678.1 acyl--CoA ligase [Thalassovita aquimarina]